MTDDKDDDADDGNFDDTLSEILGASSRVTTFFEHIELPATLLDYFLPSNKSNINQTLDLDLAFGAVHSNVDLACTALLSPLSPLPPPLPSPPPSAAAGEPIFFPLLVVVL